MGEWKAGEEGAVGHLNEMYVRDVNARQKNTKLGGNLNYDNDVYSFVCFAGEISMEIVDFRDVFVGGFS
jgi:hypothetical protein